MLDVKYLRNLQKELRINELMTCYDTAIEFPEDGYYILCITLIDNYDTIYNDFIVRLVTDMNAKYTTEQSFNLSIRLMVCLGDKVQTLYFLDAMRKQGIPIKKRTLSPLIELASALNDFELNQYIFKLTAKLELELSEDDYYKQLCLLLNHDKFIEFRLLFNRMIEIIPVFAENTIELFRTHFHKQKIHNSLISNNRCVSCRKRLKQRPLFENQRNILLSIIKNNIAKNHYKFNTFIQKLKQFPTVDYILDGANIGYFKQRPDKGNPISYKNIDRVVEYLEKRNKTIMIFLHEKHIESQASFFIKKWQDNNILYITDKGLNDDWFWLYAALKIPDAKIITNDNMCDHYYQCLHQKFFRKWRELNRVSFNFVKNNVVLNIPKPYLVETQQDIDGYHIPYKYKNRISWICVH